MIAKISGAGTPTATRSIYFLSERVLPTVDLFVTPGAPFYDTANGGTSRVERHRSESAPVRFDTVIPGHGPVSKKNANLGEMGTDVGHDPSRIETASVGGADNAASGST